MNKTPEQAAVLAAKVQAAMQGQGASPPTAASDLPQDEEILAEQRAARTDGESQDAIPKVWINDMEDGGDILILDESSLDPAYRYRFVLDSPTRIARRSMQGYTMVSVAEDGVKPASEHAGLTADDRIRVGDTVLMKCPIGRYNKRREGNKRLTDARLSVGESQFRKRAREGRVSKPVRVTTSEKDKI